MACCNKEKEKEGTSQAVPQVGITDPGWTKHVLSYLSKEELNEGHPTVAGLRRLALLFFAGFDIEVDPIQVPTTDPDNMMAVVRCRISANIAGTDTVRVVTALGEAGYKNTVEPYCNHLVSTAETRAEGRALKKLLGLNLYTHEEMIGASGTVELATDTRLRSIRAFCKKLNIDLEKFLVVNSGLDLAQFETGKMLSKEKADSLLEILNGYNSGTVIPETLKG